MKKAISLILSLCLVLSAFTAVPLTVFAEEGPDLSKCIMFDASTTGIDNILEASCLLPHGRFFDFTKLNDKIWYIDLDAKGVLPEEGNQSSLRIVYSYTAPDNQTIGKYTYPLLFDSTSLGDTVYFTGEVISYSGEYFTRKGINYGSKDCPEAKWRSGRLGTEKIIDSEGNVTGDVVPYIGTNYDLFLSWLINNDFYRLDPQVCIDNAAIGLGLTENDVERAIAESEKSVNWNRDFSLIEGPHYDNLISFDASSAPYYDADEDNISSVDCEFLKYNGFLYTLDKKLSFTKLSNGEWVLEPETTGIDLEQGKQYCLRITYRYYTYQHRNGYYEKYYKNEESDFLLFDSTCLGDTAYYTSSSEGWKIKWRNNSLGQLMEIDKYGNVTGESVPNYTTAYEMFADFLKSDNVINYRYYEKGAQNYLDDIAIAMGLTEDEVERAIAESGKKFDWVKNYSSITGPHYDKLIKFDVDSTGIENIDAIELAIGGVDWDGKSTNQRFKKLRDGNWVFDFESGVFDSEDNPVKLEEDKQYTLTFTVRSKISDEYGDYRDYTFTYPLLFDLSCLGDTVYFSGDEHTEIYGDGSTITQKETRWRSSNRGSLKQIFITGEVFGDTLRNNETDYDLFFNFIRSQFWSSPYNDYKYGKSHQKLLDEIAIALGLTEDDVEKAVGSITSDDGKPQWYRYFSNISGGKEDYSDRNVVYVDTSAVSDSVKDYYQTTCTTGIGRYPVIRINENTWVWSPDVLHYYQPTYSTYDNGEYIITPAVTSCTLSIGIYVYNDGILQEHPVSSFPCRFDSSCCGDTLVIEESTVTVCDNYNSTTIYNRAHWKKQDNAKYGMIKKYLADDDYTLFGEAETSFRDRVSLLQFYVNNILPKVSPTVIDTDQMLIDAAAEELGMKKGDVRYALNNNSKWNADESELPEGFSYDKGDYYLRRVGDSLPYGYYSFMLDAPTQYYALNSSGNASYASSSSSSSSSSSGSTGYVYKPINKFEVVRCDGDESFTTVSREPIATNNASFWFFRPGEDYNFGYNTYGEMREGSSGGSGNSSAYPITAEFPLAPPRITSVTNEVGGVTLKWNAVDGAKMYRAFVKGDTDWIAIGDTAETTFTYTGATSGAQSSFMVRCVSSDGTKYLSNMTEDYNGTHYVAAPVVTSTQGLAEGNRICWSAVPGNARFRVFVKSGKSWKALGDTYDTTFVHSSQGDTSIFVQPGTDYTYTVACVSFNGKQVVSGYNKTGWTQLYEAEEREPVPKDDPDKIVDIEMNDPGTGITVSLTDNANGLALSVEPLEDEAVSGAKIDGTLSGVYNISLIKNNAEYQPEARATAAIPCNDPKAKVCRVEDDNSVTDMNAQFSDGALTFELNGPGKYIVTSPAEEPAFTLGDVNGDNKVDITDATMIQKAVAELVELNEAQRKAADVNGDNKVDITDATMIQKYVAEIIDHLG